MSFPGGSSQTERVSRYFVSLLKLKCLIISDLADMYKTIVFLTAFFSRLF